MFKTARTLESKAFTSMLERPRKMRGVSRPRFQPLKVKTAKTITERKKLISSFERTFEMIEHPMMREFSGKSEDMYMFNKELRSSMRRFFDRVLFDEKIKE